MQQQLDTEVKALVDNFCKLVKSAKISVKFTSELETAQENLQIDVHSARIVQAGEALLQITSELKRDALLGDVETLNRKVAARVAKFDKQTSETDAAVKNVADEVELALRELEDHYYASPYREDEGCDSGAPTSACMQRLEELSQEANPLAPAL
ncbi:hypothetical protein CYMTET_34763 [Cymbomonas tetramitiformis]|uniref:Mediator of RNA polymerase II transcription subunit 22 n=1 Tax=Cymbomonas tetramitiformis TaxID=36881 RepID=A0AAE0KPV3_9CHLO|nr:hypothetical protein CYMTET_34763 [Cymbomonas tetramitiformis]